MCVLSAHYLCFLQDVNRKRIARITLASCKDSQMEFQHVKVPPSLFLPFALFSLLSDHRTSNLTLKRVSFGVSF